MLGAAPLFDVDEGAFSQATLEMFQRSRHVAGAEIPEGDPLPGSDPRGVEPQCLCPCIEGAGQIALIRRLAGGKV